jgi:SSS family solute:Na+ symporter
VTPPLVVVIFLACVWPRFDSRAAFWTLILGSAAIVLSLFVPQVITPIAHGIPGPPEGEYSYIRSLYGLLTSGIIAVILTLIAGRTSERSAPGYTLATIDKAQTRYKGGPPDEPPTRRCVRLPIRVVKQQEDDVRLPRRAMDDLGAAPGDLLHLSDARWWLGGLRSTHVTLGAPADEGNDVQCTAGVFDRARLLPERPVRIEKIL